MPRNGCKLYTVLKNYYTLNNTRGLWKTLKLATGSSTLP